MGEETVSSGCAACGHLTQAWPSSSFSCLRIFMYCLGSDGCRRLNAAAMHGMGVRDGYQDHKRVCVAQVRENVALRGHDSVHERVESCGFKDRQSPKHIDSDVAQFLSYSISAAYATKNPRESVFVCARARATDRHTPRHPPRQPQPQPQPQNHILACIPVYFPGSYRCRRLNTAALHSMGSERQISRSIKSL